MTTEAKIKQWGNSMGIIIPRDIVRQENLHIGDTIKIKVSKNKKLDGFGMFPDLPSFERDHDDREEFW